MASTVPPQTRPHVLIIGAGITGVVLAHGLQQAGYPVSIFEREPANHPPRKDWTIAVHWSVSMLEKLMPPALYARISEAYTDPCYPDLKAFETVSLMDGETGDIVREITAPGMIRIDRNRLRKLCSTDLPIQYDKALSSLSYSADGTEVTAHFQDGTATTGNIVLGADGSRSVVRRELLGEEKSRLSPSAYVNVLIKVNFNDAQKALHARQLNPIIKMAMRPSIEQMSLISIQDVKDEDDPTTWTFVVGGIWRGKTEDYPDNESRLAAYRKGGANFCEPFRSVSSWVPDGTPVIMSTMNYWQTIPWDNRNGRATLIGDAAHPMTPMRGQGLNNCLADISNFVDAMARLPGREGLSELVTAYEAEMVPRGNSEVHLSVTNLETIRNWDEFRGSTMMTQGLQRSPPVPVSG